MADREISEKEELLVGFLDCITAISKTIARANERYETEQDNCGNKLCDYDKYWVQRNAVLSIADSLNGEMFQQVEHAIELLAEERWFSEERFQQSETPFNMEGLTDSTKRTEKEYSLAREEIQVRGFVDRTGGAE